MGEREVDWALDSVLDEIRNVRGVDFSGYRMTTLRRRFVNRMAKLVISDPMRYLEILRGDPDEHDNLVSDLTVGVSSFFRDPLVFELLRSVVLPRIAKTKLGAGVRELRLWCAGCARGEEAYSMAITVWEYLKGEHPDYAVHIFATDINPLALKEARIGRYTADKLGNVKLRFLREYFVQQGDRYEVMPFIRSLVHFSRDDLTDTRRLAPAESIYGGFDVVFCRNVLIYFEYDLQVRVFNKLINSLWNNGYLVLGESEYVSPHIRNSLRILTPLDQSEIKIYEKEYS